MIEIINKLKDFLVNINSTQVALISVAVTLFLFFLGKRKENQLKIYEIRKENYQYLLSLFKNIFSNADKAQELTKIISKEDFYNVGSSLAIYGSKHLYKKYCIYRELSVNEHWQNLKFYDNSLLIFLVGEMYQIMRKEIGLNFNINAIDVPNLLSFFLNDINKPEYRIKYYEYKYKIFKIKLLIICGKIEENLWLIWIINRIFKPIVLIIYMPIHMLIKLIIVKPIKTIFKKNNCSIK